MHMIMYTTVILYSQAIIIWCDMGLYNWSNKFPFMYVAVEVMANGQFAGVAIVTKCIMKPAL